MTVQTELGKTPGRKTRPRHSSCHTGCLDATSKGFIASQTQCYLLARIPQGIQGKAVILYVLTAEVNDSITTPNIRCTAQTFSCLTQSTLLTTPSSM